ncbi:hypothetical protein TWF506_002379 [Arthrobotrys conoides]|uniref:Uncharacterized protein n=1 Tax=Arthrobotrys conoides TaxID=74498 RepID=A0AAN8P8U3_9PEZI
MPPDRYPVYNVTCGAFSLKRGNLCFHPEDEKPILQLRYEMDGARECFCFYEARVRQFDPEGNIGITPKTITFAKLTPTRSGPSYEETSLEDSHHAVASTLTTPQLEGVEWKFTLKSPFPVYRLKQFGDLCTNWVTRTLREVNYEVPPLQESAGVIEFEQSGEEGGDSGKRFFRILEGNTAGATEVDIPGEGFEETTEAVSKIVKWVVMSDHQGSYNVPEVPAPRILWTIPKRYLENRNFEQKEKEGTEEMEKKQREKTSQEYKWPWEENTENKEKQQQQQQDMDTEKDKKKEEEEGIPGEGSWWDQKPKENPRGSWGDEPKEQKTTGFSSQKKAVEREGSWWDNKPKLNTNPTTTTTPQGSWGDEAEESEEVEQPTEEKKKRRRRRGNNQGSQEGQGEQGGNNEKSKEEKREEKRKQEKERKEKEIEEKLSKVPEAERWWEPTAEDLEKKKQEEEKQKQQKPGWWGEELWKKRQEEKEEENRKRVAAGGDDRWWDYEVPPNPTGWW